MWVILPKADYIWLHTHTQRPQILCKVPPNQEVVLMAKTYPVNNKSSSPSVFWGEWGKASLRVIGCLLSSHNLTGRAEGQETHSPDNKWGLHRKAGATERESTWKKRNQPVLSRGQHINWPVWQSVFNSSLVRGAPKAGNLCTCMYICLYYLY